MPLIPPPRNERPTTTRMSRGGSLLPDPHLPRVGLVGEPGMQLEVALTKAGYHGVVTVLGGPNMAAAGFYPAMLREHAQHCLKAADEIERRHGR